MNLVSALLLAGGIGLSLTALAAIVRIVRGPTILDRMIAADVLLTTLLLSIGANMVARNNTVGIPIMIVIAATGTFATIVVALYVRRRTVEERFAAPSGGDGHG